MRIFRAPFKSKGGVHPPYRKESTAAKPIREMPLPPLLRVSLAQQLGAPSKPLVKKGDHVLRGQKIAEATGFVSATVHAPTSGTVTGLVEASTPAGGIATAVEIKPDAEDRWDPALVPHPNWTQMSPKDLVGLVAEAGIIGMGGAGFPTHVKLSPPPAKPIDTLIINGAECEPFLTADHRLMVEYAEQIATGAEIIRHVLGARALRIAIEDNKPDAIKSMEKVMKRTQGDVAIVVLRTEYPQGAEKQLIFAITGRAVPAGGLPMDVGCLVENVGTTAAVWDAIVNGRPLVERVTTVTGRPVTEPSNVRSRIGVSCAELVGFCGGTKQPVAKWIAGGPMMGLALASLDTPITKTTSGLVALTPSEVFQFRSMPCISCGRCVAACPMKLLPCTLSLLLEAEDHLGAESINLLDCIECGCCAYECPAHRPLVQQMRQGKARVLAMRREREKRNAK